MSGLLDKANKATEDKEEAEVVDAVVEVSAEGEVIAEPSLGNGLNMDALKFQIGAVVGFIVTMILVFFIDTIVLFGDFTLDDLFVPGVILWWLVFNGEDLKAQQFDLQKLGVTGVAFLVVTGLVAGVAIFSGSNTTVTISEIAYDGDDDEIDLSFYGPKGAEYTIEVLVDGKVEYTHDATINIDKGSHSVSLDDFWKGNAENMNGKGLIDYEIRVTSDGGEDSMTFDDIMNREVDTAFIKVMEEYDIENNPNDQGNRKDYKGIYVEMIVGLGNPSAEFDFENGVFTGKTPQPIESDWDATIRVLGGDNIHVYELSADEGIANGYGDFNFNWVSLHTGGGYLDKDDFYGSDGCYTFEITIENEHGSTLVSTDSQIRFYWEDNSADWDTSNDKPAEAC
ncbi:MAG: hypothetical protein ACPHN0_01810 [Candidatus Poseidoniaceae archaeon]